MESKLQQNGTIKLLIIVVILKLLTIFRVYNQPAMIEVIYKDRKRVIENYTVGTIRNAVLEIKQELTEDGYIFIDTYIDIRIHNDSNANLLLINPLKFKN